MLSVEYRQNHHIKKEKKSHAPWTVGMFVMQGNGREDACTYPYAKCTVRDNLFYSSKAN